MIEYFLCDLVARMQNELIRIDIWNNSRSTVQIVVYQIYCIHDESVLLYLFLVPMFLYRFLTPRGSRILEKQFLGGHDDYF